MARNTASMETTKWGFFNQTSDNHSENSKFSCKLRTMGQQKVSLLPLSKVHRSNASWEGGKEGKREGGLEQRMQGGEGVAAGRRHSWFLTEEAQMEAQVLLPAAVCCYHSSQHCCLASLGAAALQHSQTPTLYHTNPHFSFQLRWQEEGSDESTAPQPEPQDKLTCW